MEGTLGAVDRVSLRGDVREAALQGMVSRKRGYAGRACGWTLGNEGASSRMATPAIRENRFATGGVRADQVGEKLPLRAIAVGRGSTWVNHKSPWPVNTRLVGALIKGFNHSYELRRRKLRRSS
jgi:hypothetical protein